MQVNPFRPGHPIVPGMFIGRIDEIKIIETCIKQTLYNKPMNFMLTGERGIGKTSLLMYTNCVATGGCELEDSTKSNFLVLDLEISTNTTQVDLIKKIQRQLERKLAKDEKAKSFFKDTWSFAKNLKVAGVSYSSDGEILSLELLADEFIYSLSETSKNLAKEKNGFEKYISATYDGIIILIDEADNASVELDLGTFLKLSIEKLEKEQCTNIMFGLAGLPSLQKTLASSHHSSLRAFEDIYLGRLEDPNDVMSVINTGLEEAERSNGIKKTITDEAMTKLILFAEGYPHFIQQFAYSAFEYDTDDIIDNEDIMNSLIGKHGALEQIGSRYYKDDFYNKIQKDSYRDVLRIMADIGDRWVTKGVIRKKYLGKEKDLDNAIKALRDRDILVDKEGERGVYRLQYRGFALWIKIYGQTLK